MASALYYSIVSVVFVLGVMIVVHEFGHFAAAKLFGVRVEVFSVGFGKRLLGFRKGDTDYRISLLPFGGYVKMAGENPLEARTGGKEEFASKPRWQRVVIALAGPVMNILLAIGLLTGVFMVRYEHAFYLDQPAVVAGVTEGGAADKAGIQPGDRIIQVGSTKNPDWETVQGKILISPHQPVHLVVQRGDQQLAKTIVPGAFVQDQGVDAGLVPEQPFTITHLEPGMPAQKAGLRLGDRIVAVNGAPVRSTQGLFHALQQTKDAAVTVTVMRDGQPFAVTLAPVQADADGAKVYRIGIVSQPMHVDKLPFGEAFSRALDQNKRTSMLILEMVQRMVQRKLSIKQMEGPIRIAQISGEAAREKGWTPLLGLMAAISLNLGIFNLFPIPILDGGLILLLMIESVLRRDISQPIKERIYQAAFVCLIVFAGLVVFNDVLKVLPGLAHHIQ